MVRREFKPNNNCADQIIFNRFISLRAVSLSGLSVPDEHGSKDIFQCPTLSSEMLTAVAMFKSLLSVSYNLSEGSSETGLQNVSFTWTSEIKQFSCDLFVVCGSKI